MKSDLNLSAQVEGELIRNLNLGRHYGRGRNNRGGRGECLTPRGNMIAWIRQKDLGLDLSPSFMDSAGPRTIKC